MILGEDKEAFVTHRTRCSVAKGEMAIWVNVVFDSSRGCLSLQSYLTETFLAATCDTHVHLSLAGWIMDGGRIMQFYL